MTILRPAIAREAVLPPAYAAAAKAKLKRDRESYTAFRRIDQAEHDAAHRCRVDEALTFADSEVRAWCEDVKGMEPEATAALVAFRSAEDRSRSANEFARQQRAAYELGQGKDSTDVGEETEALIRADAADQVAADAAAVLEQKQAEMDAADKALAEAREGLAEAELRLGGAKKASAVPAGQAPISDVTIRANVSYLQSDEVWDTLSRTERQRVWYLATPRDLMSGQEFLALKREILAAGGYRA